MPEKLFGCNRKKRVTAKGGQEVLAFHFVTHSRYALNRRLIYFNDIKDKMIRTIKIQKKVNSTNNSYSAFIVLIVLSFISLKVTTNCYFVCVQT